MNILITGGAGFIGTNCALYFSKNKKNKITIIDDFSRKGVEKNAQYLVKNTSVKIIKTDVGNTDKYLKNIKEADSVIHLAGQTAVTTSITDPLLDFNSNLSGAFKLLEAVRKNNPRTVLIYSSTNKVYGNLNGHQLKKDVKNEKYLDFCHPQGINEDEKIDFISPYGCSKGAVDFYFQDYARIYNLRTVIFRQSCIYGPHQIGIEDQGWVAHFVKQHLLKKSITLFGDGYQVRDLLFVNDLICAYEKAIKKINQIRGQVFNIGGGIKNSYSLLQCIKTLKYITKVTVPIKFRPARLGDQKYFVSDNKKITKALQWQPKTDFISGIRELVAWQKDFYNL